MASSLMPTVDEKNPGDQNSFLQYIFLTSSILSFNSRLVLALIFPMILETLYFRGIIMIRCT